jgi:hypothetical protein
MLLIAKVAANGETRIRMRFVDKIVYNKSKYMFQSAATGKVRRRVPRSNRNPQHLITTSYPSHIARELCEHPVSRGWDVVSTIDRLYCDMENKQLYSFCEDAEARTSCFNTASKRINFQAVRVEGRDVATPFAQKNYTTSAHWRPSSR